jgi:hypothetical protein
LIWTITLNDKDVLECPDEVIEWIVSRQIIKTPDLPRDDAPPRTQPKKKKEQPLLEAAAEEAKPEASPEDILKVCGEVAQKLVESGRKEAVRKLLDGYGVSRVREVPEKDLPDLLIALNGLG